MRMSSLAAPILALALAACGETAVVGGAKDLSTNDANCALHPEECGGCQIDAHCKDAANPRCNVVNQSCVPCLPANDNCPPGQICSDVTGQGGWQCNTRCKANADCQKLGGGSLCCNGACVNPATEVANCGACGTACPPVNNGTAACAQGNCVIGGCNPGFADCDTAYLNGCEVTTGNDAANCGKCGTKCTPFANGLPTCSMGVCAAICQPGYADCDNNTNNGCEIDTTLNVLSCGGCGRACAAAPNADPACDQGVCAFRCKLGFSNCDGNPANGCEVDNSKDSNHCGHCGNICPLRPNAMGASCGAGQCINTCNMGFGDCDLNPNNGCEADLSNSLAACGACGKPCKNNNAVPTCAKGVCTLQCAPGFIDCNMDGTDGCEAKLLEDANNCGACGNKCPQNNPFCSKGVCGQTPPYPAACTQDKDVSGSFYIICAMNGSGAFITANNAGGGGCTYAALAICQKYNFTKVTRWGGTCGTICGYCGAFTCQAPQGPFSLGGAYTTFDSGGGNPVGGANISCTVHWECAP